MIAIAGSPRGAACSRQWNDRFLQFLPTIREQAEYAFRRVPVEAREELVQEVVAMAYRMFHRLAIKGKMKLAYPTPLAQFSIRNVRAGRRIGSPRNKHDVTTRSVPAENGFAIKPLDRFNPRTGRWHEVLVEDRTAGPAEIAAARIDWAAWLRSMSRRQRAIASLLARGETTGAVARKYRISAGRISQLRTWFRENWEQFHGADAGRQGSEPIADPRTPVIRGPGTTRRDESTAEIGRLTSFDFLVSKRSKRE